MSAKMKCTLHVRTGREGPQHDPYAFEELTLQHGGWRFTLHVGLGCWMKVNNLRIDPQLSGDEAFAEIVQLWEHATGITVSRFKRAYDRVHPDFDDPMGRPGDYA